MSLFLKVSVSAVQIKTQPQTKTRSAVFSKVSVLGILKHRSGVNHSSVAEVMYSETKAYQCGRSPNHLFSLLVCVYQEEVERQWSYSFFLVTCIWFEFAWLNIHIIKCDHTDFVHNASFLFFLCPFSFYCSSFSGPHCGSG